VRGYAPPGSVRDGCFPKGSRKLFDNRIRERTRIEDKESSAGRSDLTTINTLQPTKSVGFFSLRVRTNRSHGRSRWENVVARSARLERRRTSNEFRGRRASFWGFCMNPHRSARSCPVLAGPCRRCTALAGCCRCLPAVAGPEHIAPGACVGNMDCKRQLRTLRARVGPEFVKSGSAIPPGPTKTARGGL
jgi:hypothetical protein